MTDTHSKPSILTTTPSDTVLDRALTEAEFEAVWAHFLPYTRRLCLAAMRHTSLHAAEAAASGQGQTARPLAGVGGVRDALASGAIDDVLQDVAIALLKAVRRGGVRASEPVIRSWLKQSVPRIVRRSIRGSAMLLFAAGPARDREDAEEQPHCPRAPDPEAQVEARSALRRRVLGRLDAREHKALRVCLGEPSSQVADELGLSPGGLRTLLHRLRKRLQGR